jgi:nucleoid-associated protein YgaU
MPGNKRYSYRQVLKNRLRRYFQQFRSRNVRGINHYSTPTFSYPNSDQFRNITTVQHAWKQGDRYYKLAEKYYGDKTLWWVIASFNHAPTESHLKTGVQIEIPLPVEVAVSYLKGY